MPWLNKCEGGKFAKIGENENSRFCFLEKNKIFIFQMKIRPRDARLCADVSTGIDSLGRFRFHDLVQLDQQTVGVIVRIEKEALEVLNMHGKVVRIKPQVSK